MKIITAILDILFPPHCAFCGKLMDHSGSGVCPECEKGLPFIEDDKVLRYVGEFPCAVALYYDDMVAKGVRALKFGRKSWRTKIFGRYVAQAAAEHLGGQFDAVTFVPVSWKRNFSRGFDQAKLLAVETAKIWDQKAEPTLRKIKHNRAQSSLDDPKQRQENVKNAYSVPKPEQIKGKRFLLIDDVATTGSTLAAAAETLMQAGAASVVCAALAGGHRSNSASKHKIPPS